jgi:pimeloyl-ACP methyl ester carboxylesterase
MDKKISKQIDVKHWANMIRSILSGVVGDYLVKENNPLAIDMAFYHQDKALLMDAPLSQQMQCILSKPLSNKIIILVHGLTNLETVWDFKSEVTDPGQGDASLYDYAPNDTFNNGVQAVSRDNYGVRIHEAYGFTPFYLRYNTGLSINQNGQKFHELLNQLQTVYPIEIEEFVLMGFSMGGLLLRSAQKIAQDVNAQWINRLSSCYYIATPHEGSPLEKFGHLTSSIIRLAPKEYISHWADWIDMRSQGIQDLKHGHFHLDNLDGGSNIDEEDSLGQGMRCGSFYVDAHHHFISGALSKNNDSLINHFFGDSLVRQSSAKPISAPKDGKSAHFDGIGHFSLACSNEIYRQIHKWFDEHESDIELKTVVATELSVETALKALELSNQQVFSACMDLLFNAYDHTVNSVEEVHHSIAEESFYLLKQIPLVSSITPQASSIHNVMLDKIYGYLKRSGKLMHKGIMLIPEHNK